MSPQSPLSEEQLRNALAGLALLGRAGPSELAAVCGLRLSASSLEQLAGQPGVLAGPGAGGEGGWSMDARQGEAVLARLEQEDPPVYRRLAEQAARFLAGQLKRGEAAAEPLFAAALDRAVGRVLLDDPPALLELVTALQDTPLAEPANRQRMLYFEGLGLGMQEQYPQALAVLDRLLAEPDLERTVRGRALNSRAVFCRITGRLEEAVAGYRASMALWQELGNTHRQGLALLNLGIVAYQLQDYPQAEDSLEAARRCFEQTGSAQWMAAVDNELGLVYRDQGRWEQALAALGAAAAQRRLEGAADMLGRALNNTGEVLFFMGRLEQAITAFQQALDAMSTRLYAVDVYLNLGMACQVHGDLVGALAAFRQALELSRQIERRDILAEVHYRLGEALRRGGEDEAALEQFFAAADVIEAARQPLLSESLRISLQGRWQQVYEGLVLHLVKLGRAAQAFEIAERARGRAFAEALAGRSGEGPLEPVQAASAARVQAALPSGSRMLAYFTTGVRQGDLPLVRRLPAGSPLLEHLFSPPRTLLFVLAPGRLDVTDCQVDPNALIPDSLRQARTSPFLGQGLRRRLHQLLLEPAGEALQADTLYILPHGPLHGVPFGALEGTGGQALVQPGGPRLVYIPSGTAWLQATARPAVAGEGGPLLAVGYDGVPGEHGLRHTQAEAALLAARMGGEAWVGAGVKGEALRQAAASRRWLHFACHASFNYEQPLESYLEIGAGERLAGREVLSGWRLQAELVTLSACQTGVSRVLRGDEPMGLVRAFLAAGAGRVVVSQWAVEDLPAFLLMQDFYAHLQAGMDPALALQQAQVWLREISAAQVREVLAGLPAAGGDALALPADLAGLAPEARPFFAPQHWAAFILVEGGGGTRNEESET